ncbi:quinolinate synthase NadA [Candidatus Woesearchaeota archaeon]|nr:quinolinate synthase NadA [Candidatus Woesearchaeota archaeon]
MESPFKIINNKDAYDSLSVQENVLAIRSLKAEKNCLVLCHTYQRPEVHEIADFVGDSYGLSMQATKTRHDRIVFCGVHFMAETAKILNPEKTVLLPSREAGCALADTIDEQKVVEWKARYPGLPLVLYINSSAAVKAHADIICTSANTLKAIEAVDSDKVLLAPDKNLYYSFQPKTSKTIIPWEGYCPVHKAITKELIESVIAQHPCAVVLAHPECSPDVTELADEVLSTTGMVDFVRASSEKEFIIGTELGLVQMLQRAHPLKQFFAVYNHKSCDESCVCPYMKAITLGKVRRSLEDDVFKITVSEEVRMKALNAIQKMLSLGRDK